MIDWLKQHNIPHIKISQQQHVGLLTVAHVQIGYLYCFADVDAVFNKINPATRNRRTRCTCVGVRVRSDPVANNNAPHCKSRGPEHGTNPTGDDLRHSRVLF